jgi:hypothetical protein
LCMECPMESAFRRKARGRNVIVVWSGQLA